MGEIPLSSPRSSRIGRVLGLMSTTVITIKQVEAFYWTVKLGTFTAAAERLHTTQSAITKRIQEIESTFEIALFDRVGPGLC